MSEQTNEAAISYEEATTREESKHIYPNVWVCYHRGTSEEYCRWESTGEEIVQTRTCTTDDDGKETCTDWK